MPFPPTSPFRPRWRALRPRPPAPPTSWPRWSCPAPGWAERRLTVGRLTASAASSRRLPLPSNADPRLPGGTSGGLRSSVPSNANSAPCGQRSMATVVGIVQASRCGPTGGAAAAAPTPAVVPCVCPSCQREHLRQPPGWRWERSPGRWLVLVAMRFAWWVLQALCGRSTHPPDAGDDDDDEREDKTETWRDSGDRHGQHTWWG